MLDFATLFKNHFHTKEISDDNLKKFVQDHLGRITANNGGGTFTTMLNDTTNAYTGYFGAITDEDLAFAIQQSLTKSGDNLLTSFQKEIQDDEGTIRGKYKIDSPKYQEFFPLGKTEYSRATKANVETLMKRMRDSTASHVADFTPAFAQKYADFYTNYVTARNLQLTKIGEVTSRKSTTAGDRTLMEIQVLKNVFFVGFTFAGDVDRCMDFFDQSIIRRQKSADSDHIGRGTGKVTGINGVGIEGVNVHAVDENINDALTGPDGVYLTDNLQIGLTTFRFTKPGYKPKDVDVDIKDVGNTTMDVTLDLE